MLIVDEWLAERPIPDWLDNLYLKCFSSRGVIKYSQLRIEHLRELWPGFRGQPWYRLCRILGLYGVQYEGTLAYLGPKFAEPPKVLAIPTQLHSQPVPGDLKVFYPLLSEQLLNLGLVTLGQLHGVVEPHLEALAGRHIGDELPGLLSGEWAATVVAQPVATIELDWRVQLLELVQNAPKLCLLDLGFQSQEELTRGWPHLLSTRIKLPSRYTLPKYARKGTSVSLVFGWSATANWRFETIDIQDDWQFQIPSSIYGLEIDLFANLQPRLKWALEGLGLRRFSQLRQVQVGDVYPRTRDGALLLKSLSKLGIYPVPEGGEYEPAHWPSGIKQVLEYFRQAQAQAKSADAPREIRIFLRRLAGDTLDGIAQDYALTRERIRQIERKAIQRVIQDSPLCLAFAELTRGIRHAGGICTLGYLEATKGIVESNESRLLISCFEDLFAIVETDTRHRLISVRGPGALKSFIDSLSSQVLELCPIDRQAILETIGAAVEQDCITDPAVVGEVFDCLSRESIQELPDGWWESSRKRKRDIYLEVFRDSFPQGLQVYERGQELFEAVQRQLGDSAKLKSVKAVVARVVSHPDVVLLSRGSYIHVDNVAYDSKVLDFAIAGCVEKFKAIRRFDLKLLYQEIQAQCVAGGITSPELLHSLIRRRNTPKIGLSRCPMVYDPNSESGAVSHTEELVSYIQSHEEPVAREALRSYFCEDRGWPAYRLDQLLASSPEVFPFDKDSFVHPDRFQIDPDLLERALEYLSQKAGLVKGRVELKSMQREKSVLWAELGNHSPRFIWSVLRRYAPGRLQFLRPAAIASLDFEFKTRADEVADYLRDMGLAVHQNDLKAEFISNRGWNEQSLYKALMNNPLIVKAASREFVHLSYVGWNREMMEAVEEELLALLATKESMGSPFATWKEAESVNFPELPDSDHLFWTKELINSLAHNITSIIPVEGAFLRDGNAFNVSDLDDLVAFILARDFCGATSQALLMEKLELLDIYSGSKLPAYALEPGTSVALDDLGNVYLSDVGRERYEQYIPPAFES